MLKTYIKIFLTVIVIAGGIFIGILDMYSGVIGDATWGLSYIPMGIRALLYLIIIFLLIAIINSFVD